MIEFVRGDVAAVARTTLAHPEHDLKITLYPMFHVGSRTFYEDLSADLERFRVLLLEGVRWRGFRRPLYHALARNLGLATQREHLKLPQSAQRIPLDMSEDEFSREASKLRWFEWLLLRFLRPTLWAVTLTEEGRQAIWDSYSKKSHVRGLRVDEDSPLEVLINSKRDKVMSERLRTFAIYAPKSRQSGPAAVIAGVAHMPALYVTLRDCGYRKGNVRWFEVLEGMRVPPREKRGVRV